MVYWILTSWVPFLHFLKKRRLQSLIATSTNMLVYFRYFQLGNVCFQNILHDLALALCQEPVLALEDAAAETSHDQQGSGGSGKDELEVMEIESVAPTVADDMTPKKIPDDQVDQEPFPEEPKPEEEEEKTKEDVQEEVEMTSVEVMNRAMLELNESQNDMLRRTDQIAASREDSPAKKGNRKGKGRGRGRGRKGKGKGEVEKVSKSPKPKVEVDSKSSKPNASVENSKSRKRKASKETESKSRKRKASAGSKDEIEVERGNDEQESQVEAPKAQPKRKARVPKRHPEEPIEQLEQPKPQRRSRAKSNKDGSEPQPAQNQKGVTPNEKDDLKKTIKTFNHSFVTPYWSRASAGLKVPKKEGGLAQAG